jgi:hypothetical protein
MRGILIIVTVILTFSSAYGEEVERLVNPGFEDGVLDPWVTNGWIIDTTDPHDGDYCVYADYSYSIEQAFAPTSVDIISSVTLWAKQLQKMYVYVTLYYGPSDSERIFCDLLTNNWTEIDLTPYLRAYGSLEKICICANPGTPASYLDDTSVIFDNGLLGVENVSLGSIKAAFR